MSDKLVFDLASEVEGSPNVFIRKDWINILDNQNQNYNNNQSVLDTSQLSNSNKYMSYREAYFAIPFLLTLAQTSSTPSLNANTGSVNLLPATQPSTDSLDYALGLKNWFGQIIHSFTLDYNGTTIIQQTPYVNMWNAFKLMTSLSYNDVITQGATIGFYPDDPTSFQYINIASGPGGAAVGVASAYGTGVCNNATGISMTPASVAPQNYNSGNGNRGLLERIKYINFDGSGSIGGGNVYSSLLLTGAVATPGDQQTTAASYSQNLWKSYISFKRDATAVDQRTAISGASGAAIQISVLATIYLKHVHSFFNMCPLLKGVFMKMTMNLNNCSSTIEAICNVAAAANAAAVVPVPGAGAFVGNNALPAAGSAAYMISNQLAVASVQNSVNGVNPLMIAAGISALSSTAPVATANGGYGGGSGVGNSISGYPMASGGLNLFPRPSFVNAAVAIVAGSISNTWIANISVGSTCLNQQLLAAGVGGGNIAKSVYLYIPAYTFNPVFEQSYLSSPIKQIKYTDIYQYQIVNVAGTGTGQFNNLITNGIANIKSILILPYSSNIGGIAQAHVAPSQVRNNSNTGTLQGLPVWQSPFDPAGCCCTSPMIAFSNFNVQISGQNAIYNVERYQFEQFNNQLYGQNAVNGGLTDGLTSALIDRVGFDTSYGYYYVNVERMLPVEQSVPKSVQLLGTNQSSRAIDLYVFIEYAVDVSIDSLTGARV